MTETALADGIAAFRHGRARTTNPYDASSEEWLCWRDGWEQAKAVADHIADGTTEAFYGARLTRDEFASATLPSEA